MIKISFEMSFLVYVALLICLLIVCVSAYAECYYTFIDGEKITPIMKGIEGTLWLLIFGRLALVIIRGY